MGYALHLTYPHKTHKRSVTKKIFEEFYETTTKASYYDADERKSNIASTPPCMNSTHTRRYTARKHRADACTCIHIYSRFKITILSPVYLLSHYIQDSKLLYYHQFTYYLIIFKIQNYYIITSLLTISLYSRFKITILSPVYLLSHYIQDSKLLYYHQFTYYLIIFKIQNYYIITSLLTISLYSRFKITILSPVYLLSHYIQDSKLLYYHQFTYYLIIFKIQNYYIITSLLTISLYSRFKITILSPVYLLSHYIQDSKLPYYHQFTYYLIIFKIQNYYIITSLLTISLYSRFKITILSPVYLLSHYIQDSKLLYYHQFTYYLIIFKIQNYYIITSLLTISLYSRFKITILSPVYLLSHYIQDSKLLYYHQFTYYLIIFKIQNYYIITSLLTISLYSRFKITILSPVYLLSHYIQDSKLLYYHQFTYYLIIFKIQNYHIITSLLTISLYSRFKITILSPVYLLFHYIQDSKLLYYHQFTYYLIIFKIQNYHIITSLLTISLYSRFKITILSPVYLLSHYIQDSKLPYYHQFTYYLIIFKIQNYHIITSLLTISLYSRFKITILSPVYLLSHYIQDSKLLYYHQFTYYLIIFKIQNYYIITSLLTISLYSRFKITILSPVYLLSHYIQDSKLLYYHQFTYYLIIFKIQNYYIITSLLTISSEKLTIG